MRIAHLSDLHLSPDRHPERTDAFYEVLERCRELRADHIVITGDITNQARPREFQHVRGILREFGLLDPDRLTVTIGNHDIFGGPHLAEEVVSFPGACRRTDIDAKVKEFHAAFRETFEGCRYSAGAALFPFVKVVRGIAFIGINSVARWSALRNPLGSNGEVSATQLARLKEIFAGGILAGTVPLVLIHHHFNRLKHAAGGGHLQQLWQTIENSTMKLRKKKRLMRLFGAGPVAAVLHGHVHQHDSYERRSLTFHNAGGTIFPDDGGKRRFHLMTVDKGKVRSAEVRLDVGRTLPMAHGF